MAGTSNKCFTMQGPGIPVSASGQSEKAGSQASSSSDCSSSLVGDLASEAFNMTRSVSHICNKNSNCFCYICGEFEVTKSRRSFSNKLKNVYETCFGIQITNWEATWVPHSLCNRCHTMLTRWEQTKSKQCLKFSKPVIWSAPTSQKNCYFCTTEVSGFSSTTKHKIQYANVTSVVPAEKVLNVEEPAAPEPVNEHEEMEVEDNFEEIDPEPEEIHSEDEEYIPSGVPRSKDPEVFDQLELNDLVRDLGLSKVKAEHLASALRKKFIS
ncbi:uncharacterized protein LOC123264528 [Cotesia glomerata]|uniref:uncharacterized protein LOC123264528 n=1 Tax=Cotesia glomerata TaxID=32391 RepID=UPI001D02E860|nr:uncharacterized protein LOC123264528 [Cotesia glomerata]